MISITFFFLSHRNTGVRAKKIVGRNHWLDIAKDSEGTGYCIVSSEGEWTPDRMESARQAVDQAPEDGMIRLETGFFSVEELTSMSNTLPIDISFIDKDDIVRYFSQSPEHFFARTKSVIGGRFKNVTRQPVLMWWKPFWKLSKTTERIMKTSGFKWEKPLYTSVTLQCVMMRVNTWEPWK